MKEIVSKYLGLSYLFFGVSILLFFGFHGWVNVLSVCAMIVLAPTIVLGSIQLLYKCFVCPFSVMKSRVITSVIGFAFVFLILVNARFLMDFKFRSHRTSLESFLKEVPITNGWLSSTKGQVQVPPELLDDIQYIEVSRSSSNHRLN